MKSILVSDQNGVRRQELKRALSVLGHLVIDTEDPGHALSAAKIHTLDEIVLGISADTPHVPGLVKRIRETYGERLSVVCDGVDAEQRIALLRAGADDCFPASDGAHYVSVYIHSKLSRLTSRARRSIPTAQLTHIADAGTLDHAKKQFYDIEGQNCDLSFPEFIILKHLVERLNTPVSRSELCSLLARGAYTPSERAIDVKISRIRKKFQGKALNKLLIRTIRSFGYCAEGEILSSGTVYTRTA